MIARWGLQGLTASPASIAIFVFNQTEAAGSLLRIAESVLEDFRRVRNSLLFGGSNGTGRQGFSQSCAVLHQAVGTLETNY